MKKFAKMSLVAAVAVAGLTSYASAGSLEEAIKDTSISGYVRYRMNTDHENDMDTRGETKLVVAIKTKVNDNVTATVKTVTDNNTASKPDGAYTSDSDAKAFEWNQAFFTYTNGALTVSAGRLGLVSPMTDNGNSGNGIVATYAAGPVTLAGAYYLDTDKATDRLPDAYDGVSVYGLGVLGSVEMVNFAGWYLSTLDNVNDGATLALGDVSGYTVSADATFGPIGANIRYAAVDYTGISSDDVSYLQAGLNGSFGIVSAQLNYVKTGEVSGDTTFDSDSDAANNLGLLHNDMMYIADADAWHIGVSAAVTPEITLAAHHLSVDGTDSAINADSVADAKETELNATYKMSKNFAITGRYSFGDVEDADFQDSRVELLYTF